MTNVLLKGGVYAACLLIWASTIARATPRPAQDCRFGAFNGAPTAVPDLFTLVGQAGPGSTWFIYPRQEPKVQALVDRLSHLSDADRAAALRALAHEPPKDAKLRWITKLACYDEPTWMGFLEDAIKHSLYDDSLVNSLIPLLRGMPDGLRVKMHARIGEVYPTLSKINRRFWPMPAFNLRLAPKRSIDAIIQHTLRSDETMASRIAGGASPAAALDGYFAEVRKVTGGSASYGSREVLEVARAMQKVLREEAIRRGDPNLAMTITGSFPNGRAKLENFDIDSQLSDRSLQDIFPQLDAAGNVAIRALHPEAKLETHAMFASTTAPFAAQINPAMLRITADKIEVLMYPPIQPLNRDKTLQPYNYPPPMAYVLDKHPDGAPKVVPKPPPVPRTPAEILADVHTTKTKWLAKPYSEPDTQRLVEHLIGLTGRARKRAQEDFRTNPPRDAEWRRTIGLAVYDKDSWLAFLDDAMKAPQKDDRIYNALVPVLQKMPNPLRTQLLEEIRSRYSSASRLKYTQQWFPFPQRRYHALAPKRVLDVMITHLTRPTEIFETYAKKEGTLAALDRYFKASKTTALKGLPNGDYRAAQVLTAAREIQKIMREKALVDGVKQPTMTMAGSFPNGRASPGTSDIDVMISDPRIESWHALMTEKVNAALGNGFKLDVHAMLPTTSPHDAAVVNPVQIHISEDKIEVLVFPPFRPREGDNYLLPKNYAPPQRYIIDDKTRSATTSMIRRVEIFLAA